MPTAFAIFLDTPPDNRRPTREAVLEHVLALRDLESQGRLIAAGPFADGHGGLLLALFDSAEEARRYAENDAFVKGGFRDFRVFEWEWSHRGNGHLGIVDPEPQQWPCTHCGRR